MMTFMRHLIFLVTVLISIYANWPKLFYADVESYGISITKTHSIPGASPKPKSHRSLYEAYTRNLPEKQASESEVPTFYNARILEREAADMNVMVLCGRQYGVIFKRSVTCSIAWKCEHVTKVDVYDMPTIIQRESLLIHGDYVIGKRLQCEETNGQFQINLPIALQSNEEVNIYQLKIANGSVNASMLQFGPVPRSSVFAFNEDCMAYSPQGNSWIISYECPAATNQKNSFNLIEVAELMTNESFHSMKMREIHLYRNNLQIYPFQNQFLYENQLPVQLTQQTYITAIFELQHNSRKLNRINTFYQTTFRLLPILTHVSTTTLHTVYFPSIQLVKQLNCRLATAQFHAYRTSTMSHPDAIFQNATLLCVLIIAEEQLMSVLHIPNLLTNENAIIQSGSFIIRPKEFSMMKGARRISSERDHYFSRIIWEQSSSSTDFLHDMSSKTLHQPQSEIYEGIHQDIISQFVIELTEPESHYLPMTSHQFVAPFQNPVSKVEIISDDPAYPLISIELYSHVEKLDEKVKFSTNERYLFIMQTYDPQTFRCKVFQINKLNKVTVLNIEDTSKEEIEGYDARVLAMEVVDCQLSPDLSKPYCSSVILVWNWGIQVYEINWDANHLRPYHLLDQPAKEQEEGIDVMELIPIINLFACTYLFFKNLLLS